MPAALSKADLFARLAEGHAAGVTVVTPNKRLSQALMAEFDDFQIAKDLKVWEAPDILPFGAFVERLWEDALYSDLGEKLPLLLTPAQEQHLWEQIVKDASFLLKDGAARQCREAWRLVHQWRIRIGTATEDALAFSRWAAEYEKKTAGEIDAARLPDLMAQHLGSLKTPKLLVAYAFDVLPPQTEEFLEEARIRSVCPRSRYRFLHPHLVLRRPPRRSKPPRNGRARGWRRAARASASWCPTCRAGAARCHACFPESSSLATTSPAPRRARCRSTSRSAGRFRLIRW